MAHSDDWRPYTVPYSGGGAVKRSDGTWVPSSMMHSAPTVHAPRQPGSSMEMGMAPSSAMDTSSTAANDTGGYNDGGYTAMGFSSPTAANVYGGGGGGEGPDIPCVPGRDPFAQVVHPRFAREKRPGEGVPYQGGNPAAGGCGNAPQNDENTENSQNGQGGKGLK